MKRLMTADSRLNVDIIRNPKVSTYPFADYFRGFEKVEAVRRIFKERTEEVLRTLKVEFMSRRGYMGVSDEDGHLIVSAYYLRNGRLIDIYLDVIHELVHVRQFLEGSKLFDEDYDYVDRPTEVEAYGYAVDEAHRLGLGDQEILEYLRTEWMSEEDLRRLATTVHLKIVSLDEQDK